MFTLPRICSCFPAFPKGPLTAHEGFAFARLRAEVWATQGISAFPNNADPVTTPVMEILPCMLILGAAMTKLCCTKFPSRM